MTKRDNSTNGRNESEKVVYVIKTPHNKGNRVLKTGDYTLSKEKTKGELKIKEELKVKNLNSKREIKSNKNMNRDSSKEMSLKIDSTGMNVPSDFIFDNYASSIKSIADSLDNSRSFSHEKYLKMIALNTIALHKKLRMTLAEMNEYEDSEGKVEVRESSVMRGFNVKFIRIGNVEAETFISYEEIFSTMAYVIMQR